MQCFISSSTISTILNKPLSFLRVIKGRIVGPSKTEGQLWALGSFSSAFTAKSEILKWRIKVKVLHFHSYSPTSEKVYLSHFFDLQQLLNLVVVCEGATWLWYGGLYTLSETCFQVFVLLFHCLFSFMFLYQMFYSFLSMTSIQNLWKNS